jgi:hypothetical protein
VIIIKVQRPSVKKIIIKVQLCDLNSSSYCLHKEGQRKYLLDLEEQGIILRKKSEREEIEENVERREGIFIQ